MLPMLAMRSEDAHIASRDIQSLEQILGKAPMVPPRDLPGARRDERRAPRADARRRHDVPLQRIELTRAS
jgi:hypothetical protein